MAVNKLSAERPPIPFSRTIITAQAQAAASRVLASGWVTTGPEVAAFEKELAESVSAGYGIGVASCTAAIEIALRCLDLPRGARVLTSTMTFCGAVHAIVHAGYQPVLVDVNPRTLMPDAETTAAAVHRHGRVDAMVALHFAGHPAPVQEMAAAAGLPLSRVIEDAAHAIGTRVGDLEVGSISAATCFSFYATKNLPIGEGGMITTDDPELAAKARQIRLHGMSGDAWKRYLPGSSWRYSVDVAGVKANMTDLQAAIGRAQLAHLPRWQLRREDLARNFDQRLAATPGILRPARPDRGGRHAWHLYVLRVLPEYGVSRDDLIARLAEQEISCSVHFIPVHQQPYFQRLLGERIKRDHPNADQVFEQIVSLPFHPGLAEDDVQRICEAIADIARPVPPAILRPAPPAPAELPLAAPGLKRCLVVGAGQAGRTIARDLRRAPELGLRPIGFLDDQKDKRSVAGLPVLGSLADLQQVASERQVEVVVIAIPSLPNAEIRRLVASAAGAGASVRYLPSFGAALEREATLADLRRLHVDALIGRSEVRVVRSTSQAAVAGKRVLVTGAGGSIGSELCRQIQGFGPASLHQLDHDESNLHRLRLQLDGRALLDGDELIIADIRDRSRIRQLFRELRPEVVLHAAAHKHLPLLEKHPVEGVKSNVMGTRNVLEAAIEAGAELFINVSTDKAADPVSVLGATKRLAEMIVQSQAGAGTRVASVRFGNVLGSRGSLLSVLAEQVEKGEPITITHPDVTRFFMTIEEAAGLVLEAATMADSGEVFVLDMGDPVRIVDLVHNYIKQLHVDESRIRITFTGLRQGEKLSESLFSEHEEREATSHPGIWVVKAVPPPPDFVERLEAVAYAGTANRPADEVRRLLQDAMPDYVPCSVPELATAAAARYPDGF